ncbi:MAG: hypothetical protein IJ629_01900 [Clostridia bacterium]|nr:hypothetical protein [Clostridia bacterium]
MNIKNKLGVTLTVLVVTIVVMLILFSITFSTGTELLKNSQKNKMKTMLYMVQSRAEILLEEYLFEYDDEDSDARTAKLLAVSNATIEEKLGGSGARGSNQGTSYIDDLKELQAVGFEVGSTEIPTRDKMIYCSWNENVLVAQGIDTKNLAEGDTIIVQYDLVDNKVEVASTKGYANKGNAIHKLSDFK